MSKLTKTMGTSGIVLSMLTVAASSWACGDGTISITGLPTLGGSGFQAHAINGSGKVTGFSYLSGDTSSHSFLYDGILHDLGTLGGTVSEGRAINASGSVVGDSNTAEDAAKHAFLYTGGVMLDLGTLGGSYSSAIGINNANQIAGNSSIAMDAATHAFFYSGGSLFDLGTLGGNESVANAINNSGVVVGDSDTANFETHAFAYSGGVMSDLGTLGGDYSTAVAINDAGQIVGEAYTSNFDSHAFLYSGGSMTDLGTLGGNYSTAIAINNAGQVLGNSATADGQDHGFIYQNGTMTDLGTLGGSYSSAQSFNNLGQVVGISGGVDENPRAFLWQNGTMIDLNSVLPADSGWELTTAMLISDSGRIVGYGYYNQTNFQWYALNLSSPNTPPVANAGADQTVGCQNTVTLDGSASTDPEGDALSFQWLENGNVLGTNATLTAQFDTGSHVFTLIVTDACGESSQTNLTVQVGDSAKPVISSTPASSTVSAGANGLSSIPDFTGGVVASDNCTPAEQLVITQSPAAGTQVGLGQHIVTFTVKDASGNSSLGGTTFTVIDTTAPVISSSPAASTVSAGANGLSSIPDLTGSVVASDNCTPAAQLTVTQSPAAGTQVGLGQHTITITVKDASGNGSTASTTFTVVDTTAPVISSISGPITLDIGSAGFVEIPDLTASVIATDNCTAANQLVITQSPAAGTHVGLGNYTITVTVKDASGNTSTGNVSLKVADLTAPTVISVVADETYLFPVNGHVTPVTVSVQATDNVDQSSVTSKIVSVTCSETASAGDIQITGDLTVNLKASRNTNGSRRIYTVIVNCTDSAGNVSTGSVEIVVPGAAGR